VADVSYNEADVFDVAGRSLYSISFMTSRADRIVQLEVPCGKRNLIPVLKRFKIRKTFQEFQERLFNASSTSHPYQQLGPEYLPDVLRNHLDQFKLRSKIALSCLFEDGISEGSTLLKTINMIGSATSKKLSILTTILDDKIGDVGQTAGNHACLESVI
jgi:hypothetical protein